MAFEIDPDGGVEGSIGDLAVADLDVDRINEDGCLDRQQGSAGPLIHLLYHPIGDDADAVLGQRCPIHLGEMCGDLSGGQTLGVQRQDHCIDLTSSDLGASSLPIGLETPLAVPRHVYRYRADVVSEDGLRSGAVPGITRVVPLNQVLLIPQMVLQLFNKGSF